MSTLFFGSHELGNLIAFVATCGPYATRDGFRIYARIAADYSAYNARAWQVRYGQSIVATVPHDEHALRCACPRIPDLRRAQDGHTAVRNRSHRGKDLLAPLGRRPPRQGGEVEHRDAAVVEELTTDAANPALGANRSVNRGAPSTSVAR